MPRLYSQRMVFILTPFGREDKTLRVSFSLELITMLEDKPLGGPGWTRTNDVSKVTGLQPATLAARLLTHINALSNIHPTSILTAYRRR